MPTPDFDFDESLLSPQAQVCPHTDLQVDRRIQKILELGRRVLQVRITCANPACRAPMIFQGLPKGLDVEGASTDATGRIGQFVFLPEGETLPGDSESGPDIGLGMDPVDGPSPQDGWTK